jgi:5-methylthioribose kinase
MLDQPNDAYRILTAGDVPAYLAGLPGLADLLGGGPEDWSCRDVADGNLNAVFLVDGPAGGLCVKQALPYVRVAGESWPMDINRAFFEVSYARRIGAFVSRLAPTIHHFDQTQFVIVMEKLAPHIILRRAMIVGEHYPRVATDVAEYVAAASFFTSDLANPFETKAADQALFSGNVALQRISVDLIFTDPYTVAERNRVTAPLEGWAAAFRADIDLKEAVARARLAYLTHAQSLLHGDLHSGSIMVTPEETRVIDGEFAWVGPSGFDIGNFIAHYVMAWYATPFHGAASGETAHFRGLLAADILTFWQHFETRFLAHWRGFMGAADGLPNRHFGTPVAAARAETLRRAYVADLFRDAVMFMACKIIRRVLGFAQIADFLAIEDEQARAGAQAGALAFARSALLHPGRYRDIASVVAALPRFEGAGPDPDRTRAF